MIIKVKQKGNYEKISGYLKRISKPFSLIDLDIYGEKGVIALQSVTPVDTGKTRDSWYYKIVEEEGKVSIQFCNRNIVNGIPIAIILQYGHATGGGGYVEGIDYINPAIKPIFEKMAEEAWIKLIKFK